MQKALGDFIHALRQAGLPISSAETLDALKAAQLVGIENPKVLRHSLGMTLTKRLEHRLIYEQLFDQYFLSVTEDESNPDNLNTEPDSQGSAPESSSPPAQQTANDQTPAELSQPLQSPLAQQLMDNNPAAQQVMIASSAPGAGAQSMSLFTQIPMVSYRIMQTLGDQELLAELAEIREDNPNLAALLEERRSNLQRQVRDFVEQQYLLFGQGEPQKLREDNLQKIKLTNIDHNNLKLMTELVQKAAKKLASLHSRRRKITKRGLLDVRRTIAANAAYDGFLFHTKWKSTRIEKPKVMVICDVSGSVSRVARFLLLFLYSLQDVLPRVRSFVFSSDMGEVTELFETQDMESALAKVMQDWANMPTDYGSALATFEDLALKDIDNRTTVIMLGDARNNNIDGRTDIWQKVYQQSQRVLWLNPENKFSWDTGDSIMSEYAPYCSHVETCNSLRDLNRILGSVLKNHR
ncbi:MAG: VWA domain-containing protein [Candidatus Pelagadaptatus aseana]|uniref:vWA domain-containing protein n=1 Tax=Candidatus Pelagadaptatus aseana TaxID=3120508 RepID=UPI0039B207DD